LISILWGHADSFDTISKWYPMSVTGSYVTTSMAANAQTQSIASLHPPAMDITLPPLALHGLSLFGTPL